MTTRQQKQKQAIAHLNKVGAIDLKTAVKMYHVSIHTLRDKCARGIVESTTVGNRRYVAVATLDQNFIRRINPTD